MNSKSKAEMSAQQPSPDAKPKVTVCPSSRDNRYTFTPPPGWRGVITTDWLDRRLQQVSAKR